MEENKLLNELLILLIDIVIETHTYEPMDSYRDRLKNLTYENTFGKKEE